MTKKILCSLLVVLGVMMFFTSCIDREAESRKYVKEGVIKFYRSDFDGAMSDFNEAIRLDPENSVAYFNRGNIYMSLKDYKNALFDYDKAIELNKNFADAYYNRGQLKFYKGDRDASCEDWLKAEELGKKNIEEQTKWCK